MGNSDHSNPRSRKPAISLTAAAPAVARVRARLHEQLAGDQLQAAEGRGQGHHRRLVGRQARAVDEGKTTGLVHRRHAARRQQGDRSRRPALQPVVRRLPRGPRSRPSSGRESGIATSPTGCAARAAGRGVTGQYDSRTAYFWKQSSWGGSMAGACYRSRVRADGDHGAARATTAASRQAARSRRHPGPTAASDPDAESTDARRPHALDDPRDGPRHRRRDRRRADRARLSPPAACSAAPVHRDPARVGARADGRAHPRPPAARARGDDPRRLRHLLRDGRSGSPSSSSRPRSRRARTSSRACPPSSSRRGRGRRRSDRPRSRASDHGARGLGGQRFEAPPGAEPGPGRRGRGGRGRGRDRPSRRC